MRTNSFLRLASVLHININAAMLSTSCMLRCVRDLTDTFCSQLSALLNDMKESWQKQLRLWTLNTGNLFSCPQSNGFSDWYGNSNWQCSVSRLVWVWSVSTHHSHFHETSELKFSWCLSFSNRLMNCNVLVLEASHHWINLTYNKCDHIILYSVNTGVDMKHCII